MKSCLLTNVAIKELASFIGGLYNNVFKSIQKALSGSFNTIHGKWTNIPWIRLFSVGPSSKLLGVLKAICFTVMPVAGFHILNSQDLNHLSHRMASISLCSLCEPLPRFSHCAASIGEKIYFHGGYISDPGQGSVVDIFDPYFESWEQQPTTGTPPPGLYEGVCTSLVDSLYSFAGFDGKNLYNTLHKLDTATLMWRSILATASYMHGGLKCTVIILNSQIITITTSPKIQIWTNNHSCMRLPNGLVHAGLSRKIWSGAKTGLGGTIFGYQYMIHFCPPGPEMCPLLVQGV